MGYLKILLLIVAFSFVGCDVYIQKDYLIVNRIEIDHSSAKTKFKYKVYFNGIPPGEIVLSTDSKFTVGDTIYFVDIKGHKKY